MSGGGAKEQTVGYKIYLGLQAILCLGPIDAVLRLRWDKRTAWQGRSTGGAISVNKPGLFGDQEREGGIVGAIDFEQGLPDQGVNDYLQAKMGGSIPAFRGVAQLVMRGIYWGMNPYLKKFSALIQRLHVRTDGAAQWYDEKVAIANLSSLALPTDADGWSYQILNEQANPGNTFLTVPTSGWITGAQAPFAGGTTVSMGNTNWPAKKVLWCKRTLTIPGSLPQTLTVQAENGCVVFIDGVDVGSYNRNNVQVVTSPPFEIELEAGRTVELAIKAFDEIEGPAETSATYLLVSTYIPGAIDMNGAHMIRECLTDPEWGMGNSEDDIDDDSFMAAADQLYAENFGLSVIWDKQMPIEDFIKDVLRHIGGVCFVSPVTGKYKLKLIRGDYDPETLPRLGPGEIDSIENHTYQAAGEFVNSVTVNFWDASTSEEASVTEQDSALVQMQGTVINTTANYSMCCSRALGSRLALRELTTLSTPLHGATANVPMVHGKQFEPGDVFIWDWPEHEVDGVIMRIMGMSRGTGKQTRFRFALSQDIFGLPDSGTVNHPDSDWVDPITPATPLTTRVTIEAPYYELIQRGGQSTVDDQLASAPDMGYVLASAQRSGSAFNAQLWTDAGAGYVQQGIVDFSPVVALIDPVDFDDTAWNVVDVEDADLIEPGMYGMVGDEFVVVVSKAGAALTVGRGVLDTVPAQHAATDSVIFFDAYAGLDQTQYAEGGSVNVKMLPVSGVGPLDITAAPADTVVMAARAVRPYPPGNVKIGGVRYPTVVAGAFTVTWSHRNKQTQADTILDTTVGSVTPADNTHYGLRFLDNTDTLIIERTDIGPGTADVVLNYTGNVTMELYTIDNKGESWQRHRFTFAYTPPGGSPVNTITATAYTPVDDTTIIDGGP